MAIVCSRCVQPDAAQMLGWRDCQSSKKSVQQKSCFIVQQDIGTLHVRLGAGVRAETGGNPS